MIFYIYFFSRYSYLCFQASPGVIANPFASGIVRKNSMESISSVDRDMSPEEIDIIQKVRITVFITQHNNSKHVFRNQTAPVCLVVSAGGGNGEGDVAMGTGGHGESGK